MSSLCDDLIRGLREGVPLDRPVEMLDLAEKILSLPSAFPEGWARKLAEEFSQFDD